MIDVETGDMELDAGQRIGSSFTLRAFLSSPLARQARSGSAGPGWSSFYIGQHPLDSATVAIVVYFHGDRLDSVDLSLVEAGPRRPDDEWSEDAALAKKARHDDWLAAKLGPPPYTYPWGVIESAYDPRSVSSSISVRYTAP